ncbi:MAG: AAA family ATPase [Ferruginibacter sp.]
MQEERLIIKNFGPIKSVDLEFRRFNILIGAQATGKTMIAKLLAICRYFSYIQNINSDDFKIALKNWGLEECIQTKTEIFYTCKDYSVEIKNRKEPLPRGVKRVSVSAKLSDYLQLYCHLTPISNRFKALIKEYRDIVADSNVLDWDYGQPPVHFYTNYVAKVMDNPFFLPTERSLQSIFSLGKDSIQNIDDALFNQFAYIDRIQRYFSKGTSIEPLDILYKNEKGTSFFKTKGDKKWFKLENAPSGYQASIPIILLLKYYTEIKKKDKTFIIDEPETSLFPSAQNKLMQFFASRIFNYQHTLTAETYTNSLLITTHSPYILSSLNNLMYAFKTAEDNKGKKKKLVASVIEEKYWINPKEVSAYILKYDKKQKGSVHEKMTDAEGLLKVQEIDVVSSVLNKEFDNIMNIELGIKDETIN